MNSKTCRNCNIDLPVAYFYVHPQMLDGCLNYCKTCVKTRVSQHRSDRIEEVQAYDRKRGRTEKRRELVKRYKTQNPGARKRAHEAWAARNPEKRKASITAMNAVRDGRLIRTPCEVCGDRIVQGHHDDYMKPLEVRWLCDTHHKAHHNQARELLRAA